jgi:hypothetical protein
MTIIPATEKIILALKGTPVLLALVIINLSVFFMVGYLAVAASNIRATERADLVNALRGCIQRCEPPQQACRAT